MTDLKSPEISLSLYRKKSMARSLVSDITGRDMKGGSWIRKMFTEGARLKQEHGPKNVFDFTLGNPNFEPPDCVQRRLVQLSADPKPGMHGYMSNAGFESTRRAVAGYLNFHQAPVFRLNENNVVMTSGAGGALNVIFESILNEGDEVIVPAPYFVEYGFYVSRHRGKLVAVDSREDFQPDVEKIGAAINGRTKAVLINSPNNPTGVVYSQKTLEALQKVIEQKEQELGQDILLVSDEPYSRLVYDGVVVPPVMRIFPHSVLASSFSKDLSLAGERIGYLAINPFNPDSQGLFEAAVFNNRILGFINANALMQRVVEETLGSPAAGLQQYLERRDLLYGALTGMGYQMIKPQGTFYLFPHSPIPDDVAFCQAAQEKLVLLVPGSGFGRGGHFRISYSGIEPGQIQRSLPAFKALAQQFGLV